MKDKLLKNYINNLKKEDINAFALNNNITLSNEELDIIYDTIKNDYSNLLNGNHDKVFEKLNNKLSTDNYDKIIDLFFEYKKKYAYFL